MSNKKESREICTQGKTNSNTKVEIGKIEFKVHHVLISSLQ